MDQKDSPGVWIRKTNLEYGSERQSRNMDQKDSDGRWSTVWMEQEYSMDQKDSLGIWIRKIVFEDGSERLSQKMDQKFSTTVLEGGSETEDSSTTVQNKDKNTLEHAGNYTLRETSIFPSFP